MDYHNQSTHRKTLVNQSMTFEDLEVLMRLKTYRNICSILHDKGLMLPNCQNLDGLQKTLASKLIQLQPFSNLPNMVSIQCTLLFSTAANIRQLPDDAGLTILHGICVLYVK